MSLAPPQSNSEYPRPLHSHTRFGNFSNLSNEVPGLTLQMKTEHNRTRQLFSCRFWLRGKISGQMLLRVKPSSALSVRIGENIRVGSMKAGAIEACGSGEWLWWCAVSVGVWTSCSRLGCAWGSLLLTVTWCTAACHQSGVAALQLCHHLAGKARSRRRRGACTSFVFVSCELPRRGTQWSSTF